MLKTIKTLAAIALLSIPVAAQAEHHAGMEKDHAEPAAITIGAPAPEIEATDIHGNAFKLSDHKGKIVILEWTNAECPFVVKHYESGNMQQLQKDARAMGDVEWVMINSSADGKQGHVNAEEAKAILTDKGANPTTKILDPSGQIGHAYGAKTTPHMFVVDADGNIAYMGSIDDDSSANPAKAKTAKNYVMAAVNSLKSGTPIEMASTQPYGCSVKY